MTGFPRAISALSPPCFLSVYPFAIWIYANMVAFGIKGHLLLIIHIDPIARNPYCGLWKDLHACRALNQRSVLPLLGQTPRSFQVAFEHYSRIMP